MPDQSTNPTRRGVLLGGAAGAVGIGALSACSGDQVATATDSAKSAAGDAASAAASDAAQAAAGAAVAALTDVPVGGAVAKEVAGDHFILTQPQSGTIEAFSATCPHQGCQVAPQGSSLVCPCHGSTFDLDGKVTKGPATANLQSVGVKVSNGEISLG